MTAACRSAAAASYSAQRRRNRSRSRRPPHPIIASNSLTGCAASIARRSTSGLSAWPTTGGRSPTHRFTPRMQLKSQQLPVDGRPTRPDDARRRWAAPRLRLSPIDQIEHQPRLAPLQQPGRLAAARLGTGPMAKANERLGRLEPRLLQDRPRRTPQGIAHGHRETTPRPPRQRFLLGRKRNGLRQGGRRLYSQQRTPRGRAGSWPNTSTTALDVATARSNTLYRQSPGVARDPQAQLAEYLQWQNRYGESIAVLLPLSTTPRPRRVPHLAAEGPITKQPATPAFLNKPRFSP